ncbi:MAG: flagellar basal body P-ring formation chaperone FlgA [Bythopirellula sp.]
MKFAIANFALLFTCLVGSSSLGADLVLRERATQHGAIIRLGDIADIGASSAAELNALANTPLLPAPARGTQQFLTTAQVRDLLRTRGVQLDALTIQGAAVVEIGSAAPPQKTVTRPVAEKVSDTDVQLLVQQAIEQYVRSQTTRGKWRVEAALNETQLSTAAELGRELVASGPRQPRSGRHRFSLSGSPGQQELGVFATITQIQPVVVLLRRIERGQIIRRADAEIQQREGNLPSDSFGTLEQVVGKAAQRTMLPESIVQASHIRAPWQVLRGETVQVFVRTGGIVVRTRAVAKENGAMGDLIVVETVEDKRKLNVSVSGPSEVTVYATGGQTTDFASLQRDQRRR